jgi:hypothetical protein
VVARYRIHQFDVDGRVVATDIIDCADDDTAIRALVAVDDPADEADNSSAHAMEIWIGDRCVKRATEVRLVRHVVPMTWPRLS